MSLGDERESSGGYGGTGQTRTRLPDTDPDSYGTQRRASRSSSRSLVTVVGVVVLLIAAIAFANRGDGDPSDDPTTNKPETAATAPTGKQPVDSKAAGIPTGYAHDRQGAESAAANYAVVLVSADILKPARRPEIVRQVFDAGRAAELESTLDRVYDKAFLAKVGLDENGNAPKGSTYVSRTMPVGTRTTDYSGGTATVEVWCTGVYGMTGETSTSQTPVTSDWFTMTLQLRWQDGDWKADSFSQKEGPAPVNGDNKVSTSDVISKAVEEFGGFTYAR